MNRRAAALLALALVVAGCQSSTAESGAPGSSAGASSGAAGGGTSNPESSGAGAPATAPPSGGGATFAPPPPAAGVNCGSGSLTANQYAILKKGALSARPSTGLCIVDFVLSFSGEGDGHASVTADGSTILTVDLLYYDSNGVAGAGSGERVVTPASPIAIESGTTLSLSLSGCTGCDSLIVTVEGASR